MSIDPFEQLWDAEFLQQEIIEFFGEFDESLWNLDAGTEHSFAEHLASGEPIEDYYRDEIGFVYQLCWNSAINNERSKYIAICDYALQNNHKTAMDYGCGIGSGVITLGLAGLDKAIGADICRPNLRFLEARVKRFELDNIEIVDVYDEPIYHKVDLIVCTEVLEHVEDPIGFMRKLDDNLNPGGSMILSWSFVPMPTHIPTHFDSGLQHSHPDTITTEGFGKQVMIDILGYNYIGNLWFNNSYWHKNRD